LNTLGALRRRYCSFSVADDGGLEDALQTAQAAHAERELDRLARERDKRNEEEAAEARERARQAEIAPRVHAATQSFIAKARAAGIRPDTFGPWYNRRRAWTILRGSPGGGDSYHGEYKSSPAILVFVDGTATGYSDVDQLVSLMANFLVLNSKR
jgi:hypothetical protein